ncbi:MAG: LuxR C-terminal-related transcriptional regulator [Clostridia bacterium]
MDKYNSFSNIEEPISQNLIPKLKEYNIFYLYNIFGAGKTFLSVNFAQNNFAHWYRLSFNNEDFYEKLDKLFNKYKKTNTRVMLILDEIEELSLKEEDKFHSFISNYIDINSKIKIIIIGDCKLPNFLVPYKSSQHIYVFDKNILTLDKTYIKNLMFSHKKLKILPQKNIDAILEDCINFSHGHGLLVNLYLQHLHYFSDNLDKVKTYALNDFYNQLDIYFSKNWEKHNLQAAIKLSVLSSFSIDLADKILGENSKEILLNIMNKSCFIEYDTESTFVFEPIFQKYFSSKFDQLEFNTQTNIYNTVANYYVGIRDFDNALIYYKLANNITKITNLVVYLLENADGCNYAELSDKYIDMICEQTPKVIGAKAMLHAYRMEPEISKLYLNELKTLMVNSKNTDDYDENLKVYVRTLIASPCVSAKELKENLLYCTKYIQINNLTIENIMPTSNSDSVINGGIDLLDWVPTQTILLPIIKPIINKMLGENGIGAVDASLGELLYEQNNATQSIVYLTHALSDANLHGVMRIQYTVTGIMSRLFRSEGQIQTATEILENIYDKAKQLSYNELLPNIESSIIECALLKGDIDTCKKWLIADDLDNYNNFYITYRYKQLTKVRVFIALGRELEALCIIEYLLNYAKLYHRTYLQIQLSVLKSIILFRRNEDYEEILLSAVLMAQEYQLIRVLADNGTALLPIWKKMNWSNYKDIKTKFVNTVEKNLIEFDKFYPKYLEIPKTYGNLTDREIEVLHLLAKGENNTQISKTLTISLGTAKFHVSNIIKKLESENRTVAVKIAQEQGII